MRETDLQFIQGGEIHEGFKTIIIPPNQADWCFEITKNGETRIYTIRQYLNFIIDIHFDIFDKINKEEDPFWDKRMDLISDLNFIIKRKISDYQLDRIDKISTEIVLNKILILKERTKEYRENYFITNTWRNIEKYVKKTDEKTLFVLILTAVVVIQTFALIFMDKIEINISGINLLYHIYKIFI